MRHLLAPLTAALLLAACASSPYSPTASAQLEPTRGNATRGNVTLTQSFGGAPVFGAGTGLLAGYTGGPLSISTAAVVSAVIVIVVCVVVSAVVVVRVVIGAVIAIVIVSVVIGRINAIVVVSVVIGWINAIVVGRAQFLFGRDQQNGRFRRSCADSQA